VELKESDQALNKQIIFSNYRQDTYNKINNRIKDIIDKKTNINECDSHGRTIMMMACAYRFDDLIEILLTYRAKMNIQDKYGYTASHYYGYNIGETRNLMSSIKCFHDLCTPDGSPLMPLVSNDDMKSIQHLLKYDPVGVKITNEVISEMKDVTMYYDFIMNHYQHNNVAKHNIFLQTIDKAIKKNNIDASYENSRTLLMHACKNGYYDAIHKLIKNDPVGADTKIVDTNGLTCHYFLIMKTFDIDQKILERHCGKSHLHLATEYKQVLETLILINEFEYELDCKDLEWRTPLIYASIFGQNKISKILLDAKADINIVDKHGMNALMYSICAVNLDMAKVLIQSKANVNTVAKHGESVLMLAAQSDNESLIQLLLDNNADPFTENKDGLCTYSFAQIANASVCLHTINKHYGIDNKLQTSAIDNKLRSSVMAIQTNVTDNKLRSSVTTIQTNIYKQYVESLQQRNICLARYYIKFLSFDIHDMSYYDKSALMSACEYGVYSVVELLLTRKSNVVQQNKKGHDALYYAISFTRGNNIVNLLLSHNADPNRKYNGHTLLMVACHSDYSEHVESLLKYGADRTIVNQGETALDIAIRLKSTKCIKMLQQIHAVKIKPDDIKSSFDSDVKSSFEHDIAPSDPKHEKAKTNSEVFIESLQSKDFKLAQKCIIEKLIDIRGVLYSKQTALMLACEYNATEIVKEILIRNVDVNYKNINDEDALYFALLHTCNSNIVELLLTYKANPNIKYYFGTPLMLVCVYDKDDYVTTLLSHNADPLIKNHNGDTALDVAIKYKSNKCIALLSSFK
jgi:ankyrin repeat protein